LDRLRCIESFVTTVEEGSIAASARKLGVTPAAVSQNIRKLEDNLGSRLLIRTTRKISLTESGKVYFDRTRPLVRELENAGREISVMQGDISGRLRISATLAFGRHVIAPLIPRFAALYPKISAELILTDRGVDHIAEEIDVSVRFERLLEPGLVARKIANVPMTLCVSPDYLARRGRPQRLEELADHNCLFYRFPHDGRIWKWRFEVDGEQREPDIKPQIVTNDVDALAEMVLSGAGIARLGTFIVGPYLKSGQLVQMFSQPGGEMFDPEPWDFYACVQDRHARTPKVRTFIDFVVAALKPEWG
jgi:DNA-binding transcriptional LysR family regulator